MAVGDYVFDKQKPPPELARALNYEKWGIGNLMQLPAGLLPRMNTVLSFYHSLQNYRSATNRTVAWAKANPDQWELVTFVIDQRRKRKRGNRNK